MYNAYYIYCINNYNGCSMTYKQMDVLFKILLYVLRFFFHFFLYFCQVGGNSFPRVPRLDSALAPCLLQREWSFRGPSSLRPPAVL